MADADRLSIGEFARRVGLSVSALRFYDRCELIEPASVDRSTGYRSYDRSQIPWARLVRSLRLGEMSVPAIRQVLAADVPDRRAMVDSHREELDRRFQLAAMHLEGAMTLMTQEGEAVTASASLPTHDLAIAFAQVLPAADSNRSDRPSLTGILVEIENGVRLVATDSHRLAVADLVASDREGASASVVVLAQELASVTRHLRGSAHVTVQIADEGLRLVGGSLDVTVAPLRTEYPDYRPLLPAGDLSRRVLVDRTTLGDALLEYEDLNVVVLAVDTGVITLAQDDQTRKKVLACESWGDPITVGFNPRFLRGVIDVAKGPDVTIEIDAEDAPAVVRSATDGSYTALLMPIFLDAA